MGKRAELKQIVSNFNSTVDRAEKLFNEVKQYVERGATTGNAGLHFGHARRITGLAFLNVLSSWEEFIEQSFIRYLMGATSPDRTIKPTLLMGSCKKMDHAYMLIAGCMYSPERQYISWSTPKTVSERASIFFKNKTPFDVLSTNADKILDAIAIRNRVAHQSTKARTDFKRAALKILNKPTIESGGKLIKGYTPGDLLVEKPENFYGQPGKDEYLFRHYLLFFKDLASKIAPQ